MLSKYFNGLIYSQLRSMLLLLILSTPTLFVSLDLTTINIFQLQFRISPSIPRSGVFQNNFKDIFQTLNDFFHILSIKICRIAISQAIIRKTVINNCHYTKQREKQNYPYYSVHSAPNQLAQKYSSQLSLLSNLKTAKFLKCLSYQDSLIAFNLC